MSFCGAIVGHRLVDEVREVCGGLDALVEHEVEPRRMAQPEAPPELTTQEARGVGETRTHLLGWMKRGEGREVDARAAHVGSHAHRRHRDVAHARVLHLARDQRRQHALDLGLDALRASVRHRAYWSVLATSTRAKHSIWSLTRTSW